MEENPQTQSCSPKKDIYELLLEIKGKQETSDVKFESVIENKMKDLKSSLGVEINNIKFNSENNLKLVSDLNVARISTDEKVSTVAYNLGVVDKQLSQQKQCINVIDDKIVTLEDKSNVLEGEFLKLKCATDKSSNSLTDMIINVEHKLVSHLETIKLNVEKEISSSKQDQIHVENRLNDFTTEIDSQTTEMNNKIQELKSDFQNLKTLSERTMANSAINLPFTQEASSRSTFPNPSTPDSSSSYSNFSDLNPDSHLETETDPLYMYGDTTRTLILEGINETHRENLGEISIRCMNDIGIPLNWDDIEDVYRIGKSVKNRKWPRPVKLTIKDPSIRNQIFYYKSRFSLSMKFKSVRVHKEERKDLRIKAAKLRQAGLSAVNQGHSVEFRPTHISIDGVKYNSLALHKIPDKFMEKANEVRSQPVNKELLTNFEKCRTITGHAIMVGLSLQKTPYGLAFYSIQCFLSNFYRCEIQFRGRTYTCLEQAYQCTKALLNEESAFAKIFKSKSPAEMKKWGNLITLNDNWHNHKLQIMEDLLFCKFEQNRQLYYSLLNTRPHFLIESTLDNFWGAGCILGSIALEEGCWDGQNHLGNLLIKVRNHFVHKLEIGQNTIC